MNRVATLQRAGVFALAAAVMAVAAAIALVGDAEAGRTTVERELQLAKAASARFHSVKQAERAGYEQASPCIPGEGIHDDNFSLIDNTIAVDQPEVLLYEPKPNGGLRLVGVEYFKPDADQDPLTTADRPTLFGVPFAGPMIHPGPPMLHYDLHIWLWEPNPNGMFALPNPNVTC